MRWLGAILTLISATAHAGDGIGVPDPGAIANQPFYKRAFVSVAVGGSVGDRRGSQTNVDLDSGAMSAAVLPNYETALEGFVRFGVLAGRRAD
ncbi:MAG TPA: hypothetical protein VH143_25835 [Kofleriaceae bacterium]|jgi:hypothetical protein|nr:hypothetical protein [Kofleriaceae bacterium]